MTQGSTYIRTRYAGIPLLYKKHPITYINNIPFLLLFRKSMRMVRVMEDHFIGRTSVGGIFFHTFFHPLTLPSFSSLAKYLVFSRFKNKFSSLLTNPWFQACLWIVSFQLENILASFSSPPSPFLLPPLVRFVLIFARNAITCIERQ